ncbi:MAG TPA: hypothetical protein VLJ16_02930 [Acidobacteriota bacterium]|nr:hypothetical protein [Acidobacteriota bacterium]
MKSRFLKGLAGALALLCLVVCLAAPVLYFVGRVTQGSYKTAFLAASIGYFVFAIARGFVRHPPAAREPMP